MENPQKPHPTKVAVMDQNPEDEDDFIKREVVFHNGHWCIHAIEPVELRTAQDVRQMIEFMRDERCW